MRRYYAHPSNLYDGETQKEYAFSMIALAFRFWGDAEEEIRGSWSDELVDEFLRLPNKNSYIEDYIRKYNPEASHV